MKTTYAVANDVGRWMATTGLFMAVSGDERLNAVRLEEIDDGWLKVSRLTAHTHRQGQCVRGRHVDAGEPLADRKSTRGVQLTSLPDRPYPSASI